ncbi:hypothetical protein SCHPADRAFT_133565 [Schizopora paradoxa]|uniref:Uncharacterized protein n=1 Tax=Schizopora paradoxa TaxID=27342 RepID=A0A0H2S102_9AGAM|nr:hypothetical protein SCHPADRAFT_133565 [Schizopora paradoxa]
MPTRQEKERENPMLYVLENGRASVALMLLPRISLPKTPQKPFRQFQVVVPVSSTSRLLPSFLHVSIHFHSQMSQIITPELPNKDPVCSISKSSSSDASSIEEEKAEVLQIFCSIL